MKIVFMGTPDFALYALEALVKSRHEIVAVVTQPDRPGNRGVTVFSPIKKYAIEQGISVYQYEKISREGVADLRALSADLFVTVAFGQLLSKEIIDIPPYGIINVHASLLPKYRGSSPIQWAIIKGETVTGVTIMQTAEGLDTGDILYTEKLSINPLDNAGSMFEKLGALGARTLVEYLELLESGKAPAPTPQREEEASYYPMLKKSDGRIDWSNSADDVRNKMRGVTPWPGAFTKMGDKTVKIHNAELCDGEGESGRIIALDKRGIVVACGKGALRLTELQAEGKKRMTASDFLNGNRLSVGDKFV